MLNFPGSTSGQIIACVKALAKKLDQDCVLQAIARLEGKRFEADKLWPVLTFECGQVVKERAKVFGSVGRAPSTVDRF
jgi:hypothetical protein